MDDEDALDMFADSLEDKLQKKGLATESEKAPEGSSLSAQVLDNYTLLFPIRYYMCTKVVHYRVGYQK